MKTASRKVGRPKNPDKYRRIMTQLRGSDLEKLTSTAERKGVPLAEFCRTWLKKAADSR